MHLTNYAINKDAENYVDAQDDNGDEGHKRSLAAVLNILQEEGADIEKFMENVKDLIVKTIIAAQPQLSYLYKICQPQSLDNSMAF